MTTRQLGVLIGLVTMLATGATLAAAMPGDGTFRSQSSSIDLQVSPSNLTIVGGASANVALAVKPTGFSGAVTLSVSGLPGAIPPPRIGRPAPAEGPTARV